MSSRTILTSYNANMSKSPDRALEVTPIRPFREEDVIDPATYLGWPGSVRRVYSGPLTESEIEEALKRCEMSRVDLSKLNHRMDGPYPTRIGPATISGIAGK